ncbi:hypothetical protein [Stenotrophomonas sp. UBA7606]|uniref:hypothetical protein n=1 Tax=Stenotrophomonas sp. UBA7606 TaxID=1947559 RepID=UPI0025FE9BED|nr:hypothetical protein [Stenotrophomonas sp. UBA7606]
MASTNVTETPALGVTLSQSDEMSSLIRRIVALFDVIAVGGLYNAADSTAPAIGEQGVESAARLQHLINAMEPIKSAELRPRLDKEQDQ